MKLLALLLGLLLERVSTNVFGLREIRWLDDYFDRALAFMGEGQGLRAYLVAIVAIALCTLPIIAMAWFLPGKFYGLFYLIGSVVILFVSLGPRDLSAEVEEFATACEGGDAEVTRRVAKELLEFDPPEEVEKLGGAVASAIFVQSTNRTFGVVLWFVLLGPIGAWAFRITDLMRRRAVYESDRREHQGSAVASFLRPLQNLHGLLAWLPSRLAAMSFALAGSFEPATSAWKAYYDECTESFFVVNDDIVAYAGCGALGREARDNMATSPGAGAQCAMSLVERSTIVWLVVISLLTIAGAAI